MEAEIPITESTKFNEPSLERPHSVVIEGSGTGIQKIWRFKNGFGASVVRFKIGSSNLAGSYGSEEGKWELAVIKFFGDKQPFEITYEKGLTDDVMGHLSEEAVEEQLELIK